MSRTLGRRGLWPLLLSLLVLSAVAVVIRPVSASGPQQGDYFKYSETSQVNNGQGSYSGYSDQTSTTGTEQIQSIVGEGAFTRYSFAYDFSNNQGNASSGSRSGDFSWDTRTYTYVNGTDDQIGYSQPIYVWFAMDPSLSVGKGFSALNTHMAILSKNYSLRLPTESRYVQTIEAMGTGHYQRNDAYGVFGATYTWYEYFDPTSGYIVGYNYTEQDTGTYQGQAGGFTYTDALYVSSTSYPLTAASGPSISVTASGTISFPPYLFVLVPAIAVVIIVGTVALAMRGRGRRGHLPEHPATPPPTPPSTSPPPPRPWGSNVDLGSKPSEQVVIREVAKVNCRYCGTLIPTTVDKCPYCGGPRV